MQTVETTEMTEKEVQEQLEELQQSRSAKRVRLVNAVSEIANRLAMGVAIDPIGDLAIECDASAAELNVLAAQLDKESEEANG